MIYHEQTRPTWQDDTCRHEVTNFAPVSRLRTAGNCDKCGMLVEWSK